MSEIAPNPIDENRLRKYGHNILLFTVASSTNLATIEGIDSLLHMGFTTPMKGGIAFGTAVSTMLATRGRPKR
jgi:hypothetical protein